MDGDGTQLRGKGIVPGNDDNKQQFRKRMADILQINLPGGGRAGASRSNAIGVEFAQSSSRILR